MRQGTGIHRLLIAFGFLGIMAGLFAIPVTAFLVRPRVARIDDQLRAGLGSVDRAAEVLTRAGTGRQEPGTSVFDAVQAGLLMTRQLPATLLSAKGALLEASNALVASANTAQKAGEGIAGALLPESRLKGTEVYLQDTADQLRLLAAGVEEMSKASVPLAAGARGMSRRLTRLRQGLTPISEGVTALHARLQATSRALDALNLPLAVTLMGIGLGGIYLMLGLLSLGLGLALTPARKVEAVPVERTPLRRAA